MNLFLILYLVGVVLTIIFATAKNGKEMAYCRVLAPTNVVTPNWSNFFFMGLVWFAYWPQYIAAKRVEASLPANVQARQMVAARGMGFPMEPPRG